MKALLASLLLASAITIPAHAALKQGDKAPDFAAQASFGGKAFSYSLKKALKKGPVVVYFYPSAFTGGCDIEAHNFAEDKAKFEAAGATIIGVSSDNIGRLNDFSADPKYCASKFPVASDPDRKIATSYDLKDMKIVMQIKPGMKDVRGDEVDHALTERTTFIITPKHEIVATLSSADDKISPAEHVEKALAVVEQLAAAKKPHS